MATATLSQNLPPQTRIAYEEAEIQHPPKQKLGGVFFWMVLGIALIKDLVVDPLGLITEGVGIITLVGIVLTVLVVFLKIGVTATVFLLSHAYFLTHGGLHTSAKIKRLVLMIISFCSESVPILDLLPMTTVLFVAVAYWENIIRGDNLLAYAARAAIERKKA